MGDPAAGIRAFACLEGKEALVLEELAVLLPGAEAIDRRPGVVVVRDPALDPRLSIAPPVHPAFARAELTVWGEVRGPAPETAAGRLAETIAEALEPDAPPALHVWAQGGDDRDARVEEAKALERALRRALGARVRPKIAAAPGDEVVDVICIGPHEYLFGAHRRTPLMSAFPGGQRRLAARAEAPSRAHLKLEEGLEWAELPLADGQVAVDVGCAPGGWSFVLLERGLTVHGVDPTDVAPSVLRHPRFVEHRAPVRKFDPEAVRGLRWLFCDMNGPPAAAIGQVERMLARAPGIEAAFYTVKLSDDPPLATLADVRSRFRAAGYTDIRVRHLYHNRDELTLVARRPPRQGAGGVI